jgi:hypothetical protein
MANPVPNDLDKAAAAKSVNDYMNHYIAALDSKAGLFLAGNVAAASLLLQQWPHDVVGRVAAVASITFFAVSTYAAGSVIMPRVPPCGSSVIFWGDVARDPDAAAYAKRFDEVVNAGRLDDQYSFQNYCSARVMQRKFIWLRLSIYFFFAALVTGFIAYLWKSPA